MRRSLVPVAPQILAKYICSISPQTSFSMGKIVVKQVGHAILRVALSGGEEEQYLITLPKLNVEGIIMGSPYVELT